MDRASLTNFDKRVSAAKAAAAVRPEQRAARERLKQFLPDAVTDFDPLIGSPKWVRSQGGTLTDANGEGRGVPVDAAKRFDKDADKALKGFLHEHRALFRHGAEVLDGAVKKREHTTEHGLRTAVWEQQVDGIPVFDSVLVANTTKQGELISISSQFVPEPANAADRGTPNRAVKSRAPAVSPEQALRSAAANVGEEIAESSVLDEKPAAKTFQQRFKLKPLPGEASTALIWVPLDGDTLRLCWQVELNRREFSERFRFLVDAETGEVLVRRKLTVEVSEVLYRVYTSDSPSPMSPGFSLPTNTQPPYVQRQLLAISNLNATASPLGWINDGVMETRGNNVDAHLDRNTDDRADLPRAQATLDSNRRRVFDFPIATDLNGNLTQHPTNYADAAIVQLFYWCNFMHDKLYELGFTESAGNFQKDNFGRGGADNDIMMADAQDGSGFNNANFTPAKDGSSGKIQMYIFNGPTPARDGDLDAEVICHEYTHGLTDRLVGGGVGLDFFGHPQSGGLGEGWSDFFAEALLSQFEDDLGANYPMGGYLTHQLNGLTQNYYYGIRRYPYTTNMNVNPLTFKDIDPNQASSHPGIPRNPVITSSANEWHRQGEVWCSMLWDMRANLLRKYAPTNAADFTNANMRVLRYVTLGAQLSPPNPNFLQARDAILLAARIIPGSGSDTNQIWAAFARRGLGRSASCPESSTTAGVVEAFDTPALPEFDVLPHQTFINIFGLVGGPFTPSSITNTLVSSVTSNLAWSAGVNVPWLQLAASNGVIAPNASVESIVSLAPVATSLSGGTYQGSVFYTNLNRTQTVSQVISLFVGSPQDDPLVVTPLGTFSIQGQTGGPFTPSQRTYRLDNGSEAVLNWRAFTTNDWLSVAPTSGTLDANPNFASVTVTINSNANAFSNGNYSGEVTFINDKTGARTDAPVLLRVGRIDYLTEEFSAGTFDLTNSTITFVPNFSTNFYSACREPAAQFPSDPAGGSLLTLADDEYQQILLTNGARVSLFGTTSNAIFIGANGNIAFDPGSAYVPGGTNFFYSGLVNYFDAIRVAPFYIDLNPAEGGTISYLQLSDRLVVTYDNVPEYATTNSNNAQIELFYDGAIRMTWLRVDAPALVRPLPNVTQTIISGLSRGSAVPVDYVPSDLSAVSSCLPSATLVLPTRAMEGESHNGVIVLSAPVTNDLRVTLTSSDTNEVIVPDFIVMTPGQTSFEFPTGVIDDAVPDGTQPVTVTATFPDRPPASATIMVDDAETAALTLNVQANGREGDILFGGGVVTADVLAARPITVNLFSGNTSRVRVPPAVVIQPGHTSASFDIVLFDNNLLDETETVAIEASIVNWTGDFDAIRVTDNESRALALTLPSAVTEDRGTIPNAGRVSLAGIAPSNIVIALQSQHPELIAVPAFVTNLSGQSSVPFNLTTGGNGVTNAVDSVRISASAAGFIGATGSVHFIDDERPIVPSSPSPPHLATHVPRNVQLRWRSNDPVTPGTIYNVYLGTNAVLSTNNLITSQTNDGTVLLRLGTNLFGTNFVILSTNLVILSTNFTGSGTTVLYPRGTNISGGGSLIFGGSLASFDVFNSSPLQLDPDTTYYWKVTARLGSYPEVSSPVWQFTTETFHFEFDTIGSPQFVDTAFPVTLSVRDESRLVVANYTGSVTLTNSAPVKSTASIVISAIDAGGIKRVEFANVSGQSINIAGWQVALYDWVTWPTPRTVFTVPAPSVSPAGDIFRLIGFAGAFAPGSYPTFGTGVTLGWNNNVDNNPIAVVLRDNLGNIIDFVCASGADPALITLPSLIPSEQWSGPPVEANVESLLTYQRIGSRDQNNRNDWVTAARINGTNNPALLIPFTNTTTVAFFSSLESFVGGMATGTVTMVNPARTVTFGATDGRGHGGVSNPIDVFAHNDIALSVAAEQAVLVGQPVTYQFTITNTGPNPASAVRLIDTLASSSVFASANPSQGTCSFSNGVVTCDLGTLEPQQSATVALVATAVGRGTLTNVAAITRAEPDAYQPNNTVVQMTMATFPQVSVLDVTNAEPDIGSSALTFTLRLSAPNSVTSTVAYATSDGTAVAGVDYESTSGIVTFPPGTITRTISVPIFGDTVSEGAETFFVNLSNALNADLTRPGAAGTIADNDPLPVMTISDPVVTEGDAGTANAVFSVRLAAASGRTVLVSYSTTNGSALAGLDYTEIYGSLQLPPGVTNANVTVPVLGDKTPEPTKTFFLNLANAVNASVTRSQGVGTILDNDIAAIDHFTFDAIAPLASYAGTPLSVTVTARDGNGAIASGFNEPITLLALDGPRPVTIGSSNATWALPFGTSFHDARVQSIYQTNEIGAAGHVVGIALDVATVPSQALSNWTIRLRHTSVGHYFVPNWEVFDWSTNFQHDVSLFATGWVTFPFATPFPYNGQQHLMVDFSFDNASFSADGLCRSTATPQLRSLYLRTDSAFGRPLDWIANTPTGTLAARVPNIRLIVARDVPLEPLALGNFVNGIWNGTVKVGDAAANLVFRAVDRAGHFGDSNPLASLVLRVTGVSRNGNSVTIAFPTLHGTHYRVERRDALDRNWEMVPSSDRTGDGTVMQFTFDSLAEHQFYRVVRLVP